jgi:spermidine synthase
MKKLISYIFPLTTKIRTENNGIVELTMSNGRMILDSANANYSYGSLQRILKFGLKKIDLTKVENVLVFGLGGGSVVETLRKDFDFNGKITAIELDKKIIEIALSKFGLDQDKNLEIIHANALDFAKSKDQTYDLVIVDLYIDNIVPAVFYSLNFWKDVKELVNKNTYFIFNACIFNENSERQMSELLDYLKQSSSIERFDKVENTNTVIIGKKN